MILIELTAAIDAAGTPETFYVSTGAFVTSPTDTPAHTAFIPALLDPGSIGIHAFSDGRTGGATKLEAGEIVINNVDGAFDAWLDYSFDGRAVTVRYGEDGAYPGDFTTIFTGTAESVQASFNKIIVKLRDKQYRLSTPARTTVYAGNNSLPAGLEGVDTDLKGKVKPVAYGKVLNVSPPLVNSARLIYEVGACNSVDAVYDSGAALSAGAVYTSQSDMETTAPAAGAYRVWAAGGYVRLGSSPTGEITADVTQGAAAGNRTVAQILKQMALDAGLSSGEISSADVAALDALNSNVVGIWLDAAGTTWQQAMGQIAASIGAWYGFDALGVLRMGQLTSASGTAALTVHAYDMHSIERRAPRDFGIPVWSVTARHSKIWTTQKSGLAGMVTAEQRGYLAQEYRSSTSQDASIKTQWLLAETMGVDTLLTSSADADAESARLLALHKVRRDVFDVQVTLDKFAGLKIMDVVELVLPRFDLTAGDKGRLIGYRLDLTRGVVIMTLWD